MSQLTGTVTLSDMTVTADLGGFIGTKTISRCTGQGRMAFTPDPTGKSMMSIEEELTGFAARTGRDDGNELIVRSVVIIDKPEIKFEYVCIVGTPDGGSYEVTSYVSQENAFVLMDAKLKENGL